MDLDTSNPWKTHSKKDIYDNPWINIVEHQVTNPSGGPGIYGVVHFKNAAIGIVPIDEKGNTWLVGQYRYTLDKFSWEIPEGGCKIDEETPLSSAQRELLEETGIVAQKWQMILNTHLSNSVTDEYSYTFLATQLEMHEAAPEETEKLFLKKVPIKDAIEMCHSGEITDALSIVSLFKVQTLIDRGDLNI